MSVELVTGYSGVGSGGEPNRHVSSAEDGARQAGTLGLGCYALSTGSKLSATMEDANTLVVADGDVVMNGRHVSLPDPTSFTIPTGVQGRKVSNLAVLRYKVGSRSVESVTPLVLTGEPSTGTPSDPAYNEGSILDGDSPVDMPLYRVITDGITAGDPEPLFDVTPSLAALRDSVSQGESEIASLSAEMTQKLQKMSAEMIEPNVAASWIYAVAYLCTGGLWVCGNVTGSETAGKDGWIATVRLPVRVANRGRSILRGFFHNHQSGCWFTVSNNTVTLDIELRTTFSDGDTFSGLVPLTFL